jgi:undecaprenyl pyrophosphate synthase
MIHNIGKVEVLHINKLILLKENSSLRYKGPKHAGLKKSIKKRGVLAPIHVGRLNNELHVADGNRRTTACRELNIKNIIGIVHNVNSRDELCSLFMELTNSTQQIGAVQSTDMYLNGMASQYLSLPVRKSIDMLNTIYKTTTRSNIVLKRMVAINKSPRSYVIALEKVVEYINTDEVKTNDFAKKALYWMLNHGSAWSLVHLIKASAPVDLVLSAINNREEIPDDWWHNV